MIVSYIFFCHFTYSQNLVPNPGFELTLQNTIKQLTPGNNFTCKSWNSPSLGTPDYFTMERKGDYSVPNNIWGSAKPYEGKAHAGIAIDHQNLGSFEYLQVKLDKKLEKDKYYTLSLAICSADRNHSLNEIDFMFSDTELKEQTDSYLKGTYLKMLGKTSFRKGEWSILSQTFKANGDEQYLILGIFDIDCKKFNLTKLNNVGFEGAYLYLDNVILKESGKS